MKKNNKMNRYYTSGLLLILLLPILTFLAPGVNAATLSDNNREYAESRILNLSDDIYFVNWTETGDLITDHNNTKLLGGRIIKGLWFYTKELDPHIAMYTQVIDNTTFRVMVQENPNFPYDFPDVPVTICVYNNTMLRANRFRVPSSIYCEEGTTVYEFPRLTFNKWFNIEFDHSPVEYATWFGGDTISPQGGSSGLPVCEGLSAGLTINVTKGNITVQVKETGTAGFFGPSSAGCSVSKIIFQFNDATTNNSWRTIPTNNDSRSMDCKGISCDVTISTFGTTIRNTQCDVASNVSLRTRVSGIFNSNPTVVFSPTRNLECVGPPIIITEEEVIWFAIFFMGLMIATTMMLVIRRRNKQ